MGPAGAAAGVCARAGSRANASRPSQSEILRFMFFSLGAARMTPLAGSIKIVIVLFADRRSESSDAFYARSHPRVGSQTFVATVVQSSFTDSRITERQAGLSLARPKLNPMHA